MHREPKPGPSPEQTALPTENAVGPLILNYPSLAPRGSHRYSVPACVPPGNGFLPPITNADYECLQKAVDDLQDVAKRPIMNGSAIAVFRSAAASTAEPAPMELPTTAAGPPSSSTRAIISPAVSKSP